MESERLLSNPDKGTPVIIHKTDLELKQKPNPYPIRTYQFQHVKMQREAHWGEVEDGTKPKTES